MTRFKKYIGILLCLIFVISSMFCISANAEEIEKEKTYKPLDLVVVIDSSGSMKSSDREKTALAAVRMLVNMMPAEGSRVGIVSFNKTATVLTTSGNDKPALLSLESLTDVSTIKKNVSGIVYNGGTGIGNAVFAATELLKPNKKDDRTQAIMLFTDGVNDFGNDVLSLSKCEDNEANALLWAKNNNCPIYCVGYDYITSSGVSSMGKNGEGLKKLENIASTTSGKFKSINSIEEIEQLLIEFLADVSDLNYKTVATIPGDGGKHECKIPISPSVVEANIRIAGGDENSIKNGKIRLYDPNGNEIELRNSNNVRFDVDATAASIKVTMPKTGEWLLVVEGITGDDIHVGLLEHFKMNLTSQLTFPSGNPKGVAYSNDEIGIKAWLTYDGVDFTDKAIYDAVKSATAVCVPRANPENKKIINLTRDGLTFVGSFIIPQDCYYDITIRLDWDTVYREDTLEIKSSNKPLYIKTKIPDIKVNKNKTATLPDIYQYIGDDENDKITASISSIGSPDVADVKINGNDLVVKGNKWSSSLVTITFTDAQGNDIEATFKVKVFDPVAMAIIILIIIVIAILILLLLYWLYRKTFRITGKARIAKLAVGIDNGKLEPDISNLVFESRYRYDLSSRPIKKPFSGGFNKPGTGFAPNNNSFSSGTGFGATTSGFSPEASSFGNSTGGFSSEPSSFGAPANGFSSNNSSFGAFAGGFGESKDTFSSDKSNPFNSGFGSSFESNHFESDFVETQDESKFNGEMEIGRTLKGEYNLYKLFESFSDKFKEYMTVKGTCESKRAEEIELFVKQLVVLKEAKIIGSSAGLQGITIKLDKKIPVKSYSLKIEKNKMKTKVNSGKFVTIKLALPYKEENGQKFCYYFEIEYKN